MEMYDCRIVSKKRRGHKNEYKKQKQEQYNLSDFSQLNSFQNVVERLLENSLTSMSNFSFTFNTEQNKTEQKKQH